MRFLDVESGQFVKIDPESISMYGRRKGCKYGYAILSHTWGNEGEQTYEELRNIQRRYDGFHVEDTPHGRLSLEEDSSITFGRLTRSEVAALFSAYVEKYGLPRLSQSRPSVSTPPQEPQDPRLNGPSLASVLSEQPPSDYPSTIAPLILQSEHSNLSCFTRAMARMKSWIQSRSIRYTPPSPSGTLPVTTTPHTALECHPSPEHNECGPSHAVPASQLPNDTDSPLAHPLAAIGRLTQAEIEAFFQAFIEKHNLDTTVAPDPTPRNPPVVCQEYQSSSSPLSNHPPSVTPRPLTARERLIKSKLKTLFHHFARAYSLTIPTREYQSETSPTSIWNDPELSPKIREACRVARENGYRYIWIDSCCIDKSSSSELAEAINSMYKWYDLAAVCYAYLADVPPGEDHWAEDSAFCKSRWFRRGWTLQELIAPLNVEFLSEDWAPIGSKRDLVELVESITKVDYKALLQLEPLDRFSVAQRLSWAANRKTTRIEDQAYSLLGIFNINMPTLYGEGDRAFRRLQEQIIQHIPDQSIFAWGDLFPSSQFFQDPDIPDTSRAHHAILQTSYERKHVFSTSPDNFEGCKGVRTARHDAGQFLSSNGYKVAYTPTPYGISTQFLMVPLTRDLLLHAIPYSAEDFQLHTSNSPEGSQWYLVILRCELGERQGHCLGRVCYLIPSEESDVDFVFTGHIHVVSQQGRLLGVPDLFLLSPELIEHFLPETELKTVHIPHPDSATLPSLRDKPYTAIKLMLLRATRDALRSRGYSADLRAPGRDHPTTHCLTLSKDEHTITIEFQHTLEDGGEEFAIDAEVRMSGSRVQLDSAPDSDRADRHTVSWRDRIAWETKLDHQYVRLSAAGAGPLTMDIGLDFGGRGVYFLRVDVLSDASLGSSAIEPVSDQEEGGEATREDLLSGAASIEDTGSEDLEEIGGPEAALSVVARDSVATSNNAEGDDRDDLSG